MLLSPMVNTDIKMPKKMFDALAFYESHCIVRSIEAVTTAQVQAFLTENYSAALAQGFKPEYLYKSRESQALAAS